MPTLSWEPSECQDCLTIGANNEDPETQSIYGTIMAWRKHNNISNNNIREKIQPSSLQKKISLPGPSVSSNSSLLVNKPKKLLRKFHVISSDDESCIDKDEEDSLAGITRSSLVKLIAEVSSSLLSQQQQNSPVPSTISHQRYVSLLEEISS